MARITWRVARVTWRAAGYAANLARGRNNWPNDCKTKRRCRRSWSLVAREVWAREAEEIADKIAGRVEDFPGPVVSRSKSRRSSKNSRSWRNSRRKRCRTGKTGKKRSEIFYLNQKLAGKILSKQLSSRRNGCNLTKNPYLHSKVLTNEAEEAEEKRCRTGKTGKKRSVCNTCRGRSNPPGSRNEQHVWTLWANIAPTRSNQTEEAREAREADQNRGRRSPANIKYNQRLIKGVIQSYQVLDVS